MPGDAQNHVNNLVIMAHIFSLTAAKLFMLFIFLSFTAQAQVADFNATVEAARGQTVYFLSLIHI